MEDNYYQEVFEFPINEFKRHLEDDFNERILFSGKYGTGKTQFLQNFFTKKNQELHFSSEKYNVFRLFPVNYSIASSEDIMKYIKYDIIIELLNKATTIEEIELGFLETLPEFLKQNLDKVAATLIYMIPKLGKEVVESYEKIMELNAKFMKFHKEVNKTEGDTMISYLENLELREGSIYENDVVTKIITNTIKKAARKKSVLIVDDIDRLDPEHVFRILNVFAVHFERPGTTSKKNKFEFDKIIIVCDFNNIRNIFHHRYGLEADFMGYVDKFYSSHVYQFDNKKAVTGILNKLFSSTHFEFMESENENFWRQLYFDDMFLINLVTLLIDRNLISLRNVIKIRDKTFRYHHERLAFNLSHTDVFAWRVTLFFQLKLLCGLVGDYNKLRDLVKLCLEKKEYIDDHDFHFGSLIYILSYSEHNFSSRDRSFAFAYKKMDLIVQPMFSAGTLRVRKIELSLSPEKENPSNHIQRGLNITIELFWQSLLETVEKLNQIGYLT